MKEENYLNDQNQGAPLKEFKLTAEKVSAFSGKKTTDQILRDLLSEIKVIEFRTYLNLPKDENLQQKHIIVGVVKNLLKIAETNRWNLVRAYDYVYIYNGAYWVKLEKEEMKSLLGKAAIAMGCPDYNADHFEFKEKLLKQFLTEGHFQPPITKSNKILINLENGTFEIFGNNCRLREFDPADFLTYQLPFEYNPDASCPLFDTFLLKVLTEEASRMVLQEYSGYIFTDLNLEKILMLTGSGSNGKSVFYNILCALIGEESLLTFPLGLFEHEYNRAKLVGKKLNFTSEKGNDLSPDLIKKLASCESMQAREPHGKSFSFKPDARHIISTNEFPKLTEQTEAFYRRFEIVSFDVRITEEEKDIDLANKITSTELPGVFNWLMIGLYRIIENKKFTRSEKSELALARFKFNSDSVAQFIDDAKLIKSSTKKETIKDLFPRYKSFCIDNAFRPVAVNTFSTRLRNLGFEDKRMTGGDAAFFMETDFSRD